MGEALPPPPSEAPSFADDFSPGLDGERWIAHYLPHWTVPERSAARYEIVDAGLQLRIGSDQLDWREEDAPLRVSNVQTAMFSGPSGRSAVRTDIARTVSRCERRRLCACCSPLPADGSM